MIFVFSVGLLFSSCSSGKLPFGETKDKDLTLQVMGVKSNRIDTAYFSYKARIIPDKIFLSLKSQQEKSSLSYRMDSCFFLKQGKEVIAASMVQPIANGVPGSFEFLLEFEKVASGVNNKPTLIYRDKYLNRKTYHIQLKD